MAQYVSSDESASSPQRNGPYTTDEEVTKEFIVKFKALPQLWDPEHDDYRNTIKREKALRKLLTICKKVKPHANIITVKDKIRRLRLNCRKELRKIEESKCPGADGNVSVYTPKWWLFGHLTFLQNVIQNQDQQEIRRPKELKQNESSMNTTTTQQSKISHNVNPTALYWSSKLNKLSPKQKLFAEKFINDILIEAELGNLDSNSVTILQRKDPLASPSTTLSPVPVKTPSPSTTLSPGPVKTPSPSTTLSPVPVKTPSPSTTLSPVPEKTPSPNTSENEDEFSVKSVVDSDYDNDLGIKSEVESE